MRVMLVCACMLALGACTGSNSYDRDPSQREKAANYNLQLAGQYFLNGSYADAKDKIERSLEQNPRNAEAHLIAALLYERLHDDKQADSHFSRALSLDAKNPDIRNAYAGYLCGKGKYESGEKYAMEAATDPLNRARELAFTNAGKCARNAGRVEDAEQHFRDALSLNSHDLDALYQMADLEFQRDNYLPARAFLERFLQAAPASSSALLLGVNIERKMGNTAGAEFYARRLRSEFPTSVETQRLIESTRTAK